MHPDGIKIDETGPLFAATRVIASDRAESDSCECGTPGCCIDHTADAGSCETW